MTDRRFLLVVTTIVVLLHLVSLGGLRLPNTEETLYILLGKSLALRLGYRSIWHVGNPPHIAQPFVFPAILAVPVFFGYHFTVMRLIVVMSFVCALWLMVPLFNRLEIDRQSKALLLALCGFSAHAFVQSQMILSEMPYLVFSLAALWFFTQYHDRETWLHRDGLVCGALLLVAFFTRSIGVSLFFAMAVSFLCAMRKNDNARKLIFISVIFSIPVLWWALRALSVKAGYGVNHYLNYLLLDPYDRGTPMTAYALARSIIKNVYGYVWYAVPSLLMGFKFEGRTLLAPILSLVTFVGFLQCQRKRITVVEWYVTFFILILAFNPWSKITGIRYLVVLIPFVVFYFFRCLRQLLPPRVATACIVILLACNVSNTLRYVLADGRRSQEAQEAQHFIEKAEWLKRNTDPDDVLLTEEDDIHYLWTGRKCASLWLVYVNDTSKMLDILKVRKIGYVSLKRRPTGAVAIFWPALQQLIQQDHPALSLVYERGDHCVYKVNQSILGGQ